MQIFTKDIKLQEQDVLVQIGITHPLFFPSSAWHSSEWLSIAKNIN